MLDSQPESLLPDDFLHVSKKHGCFIPIEPVTKRLRPVIRNFFIATDLITTLATNMGLKMLPFYHEDCFELFF